MRKPVALWGFLVGLAVLLAACSTEPEQHTVQFLLGGQLFSQTVSDGGYPDAPTISSANVELSWQDAQGNSVNPEERTVTEDVTYTAVYRPRLTNHAAFLFLDENACLRPEDALTADELAQALRALAAPGVVDYFPALPSGTTALTGEVLTQALAHFFSEAQAIEGETVSRAAFARIMHSLLGRDPDETVQPGEEALLPADLDLHRSDLAVLLEASVAHTPDEDGTIWQHADLQTVHKPGFVNLEGFLYWVQEDGTFLRNEQLGRLNFGADGRYTCGDEELDALVAAYWSVVMEENPQADRLELLKIAYEHCHQNFKYLKRNLYEVGHTGWEVEDAKVMLSSGRGNCYNFAAIFWAYARGLGYEARAISGTCTDTNQPHGWVIIEIDGKDYFFDPEWQYAYRERGERGRDMFMIPKEHTWYWTYKWKE